MAQVITIAGERLFALKAQNNEQLDIDTFIFANVPGQDPNATIDRNEGLPPVAQRVHQQIVQQVGRINDNVVVYSTVLDSVTGPFDFNWVGLYSSANQTLIAVSHIPNVSKTITVPGTAGNTLNRNFGIEYSGIADLAGITVQPETWQLDFTARLSGMDELTRQLAADMNGKDWFIGDGFKVVPRSTTNTFKVTPGVGYVSGLRVELKQDHILTLQSYPQFVYVDAWFDGDASSKWAPKTAFTVTNGEMDDYIDVNGKPHYVFKLARITAADVVEDLRNINGLKQEIDKHISEGTHLASNIDWQNFETNAEDVAVSALINKLLSRDWAVLKVVDNTSISAAIAEITDASASKMYCLYIKNGQYNEDIQAVDFIDLVGEAKEGVIIESVSDLKDTLNVGGRQCLIANLTVNHTTLLGETLKYPIHIDNGGVNNPRSVTTVLYNVRAKHFGSGKQAIGIGLYGHQRVYLINVDADSENSDGIIAHNIKNQIQSTQLVMINTNSNGLSVGSFGFKWTNEGSLQKDTVQVIGGKFRGERADIASFNSVDGDDEAVISLSGGVDANNINTISPTIKLLSNLYAPSPFEQILSKLFQVDHYKATLVGGGAGNRMVLGIKYNKDSNGILIGSTSENGFEVAKSDGTTMMVLDSLGNILNSGFKFLNKAGTAWNSWATRNAGGSSALIDLMNIGDLSIDGYFRSKLNFLTLNKAGNGWLTWASRSTSGPETKMVLSNIQLLTTDRLSVSTAPIFANNAEAIAGGLEAGQVYRTGADPDLLAVVH
jgi:hypothetical protein